MMTPIEIAEYKQKWMRSKFYPVTLHSDLRTEAKEWCKNQLHKCQWNYTQFTDVYEDTVYFEHKQDQENFSLFLKKIRNNA